MYSPNRLLRTPQETSVRSLGSSWYTRLLGEVAESAGLPPREAPPHPSSSARSLRNRGTSVILDLRRSGRRWWRWCGCQGSRCHQGYACSWCGDSVGTSQAWDLSWDGRHPWWASQRQLDAFQRDPENRMKAKDTHSRCLSLIVIVIIMNSGVYYKQFKEVTRHT